jgi:UPF0716 family protein affecting phage T7 exclusion
MAIWIAVGTSIIGISLLQRFREAMSPDALMKRLQQGQAGALADVMAPMIGAVLLIIPGFFTDLLGVCLILPFTRALLKKPLSSLAQLGMKRALSGGLRGMGGMGPPPDMEELRRQWEQMNSAAGRASPPRGPDETRRPVKDADFTILDQDR